jgi:hypothetical protein
MGKVLTEVGVNESVVVAELAAGTVSGLSAGTNKSPSPVNVTSCATFRLLFSVTTSVEVESIVVGANAALSVEKESWADPTPGRARVSALIARKDLRVVMLAAC